MNKTIVITGFFCIVLLAVTLFFLFRAIKSRRKIPYQKLFEHKRKIYLVHNNRFIALLVAVFFLSIFSFIFLFRYTVISYAATFFTILALLISNLILLKRKYKIKENSDIAWLSIVLGMGQLALFLWLNFVPLGRHDEEFRITQYIKDDGTNLTTIELEDGAYNDYWGLRTFQAGNSPVGDTIVFHFNDGLLGFKVYTSHYSH